MARMHFHVETELTPAVVLQTLTDFSASRAEAWPNIDAAHFKVHEVGPSWAEVTEGSSVAGGVWERNRYEWDAAAGRVLATTLDSNTWAKGSRWDYRLTPRAGGGTDVEVQVVRTGRGLKGKLLELAVGLAGARRLRGEMEKVLAGVAARQQH